MLGWCSHPGRFWCRDRPSVSHSTSGDPPQLLSSVRTLGDLHANRCCGTGFSGNCFRTCTRRRNQADEYLSAWSKQGRFSGTVLIAKDGKVVLRKSYGMANLELGVPNTPEMIYRIGSITKSFTALAIVQLEAHKKLSVQDPVVKYVPEVPKAWQSITIQQLLTHVSGIPDFTRTAAYGKGEDPLRIEHAIEELAAQPLVSAPGEKFAYSNSGYILLGLVIEKVSGVQLRAVHHRQHPQARRAGKYNLRSRAANREEPGQRLCVRRRSPGKRRHGRHVGNTFGGRAALHGR